MRKKELLIPAGDMECLRQAVFHGADAVYLACKNFGARKFATNFTNEEIVEAIRFCHLYGVKIFVTMNTLVLDDEVDSFIEQARFLHKNGVDALIVQDFGMICLLREQFPNLDIHASTQVNNSSKETCQLLYDLGVKRVVFSRELSIDEIDSIDVPIEKEAFIHGALCVSCSGCCLMSSMLGGRSGNRGECAGSCRLPYSLIKGEDVVKDNEYLLSMKELNTSSKMDRLLSSTIYSFKVEGRMKGPLYVAFVTELYRRIIDGEKVSLSELTNQLKTIFNREFTLGHLFGVEGSSIINRKSPNHIGLKIGKACIVKDKIKIMLDEGKHLHQHDSLRFLNSNKGMVVNYLYDTNNKLCNSSDSVCFVDNKVNLTNDDTLMKTQDILLEKEYLLTELKRKIPIEFKVIAKKNKLLFVEVTDGINEISLEGNVVEEASSAPTDKNTIIEKISKVGNTPFYVKKINVVKDDNVFIQIKQLNILRRSLIEELMNRRMNDVKDFEEKEVTITLPSNKEMKKGMTCIVCNEEQLKTCLELPFIRIYVPSLELYEAYKNEEKVYYFGGRCNYSNNLLERNAVSEIYSYKKECYGLYYLNVTNCFTAYYLQKYGLLNIPVSVELSENNINKLINNYEKKFGVGNFELLCYGRIENMIIKGNILDIPNNNYEYKLVDFKDRVFPVYYDGKMTHVLNYKTRLLDINLLKPKAFSLLFAFYNETKEEICDIVNSCSC